MVRQTLIDSLILIRIQDVDDVGGDVEVESLENPSTQDLHGGPQKPEESADSKILSDEPGDSIEQPHTAPRRLSLPAWLSLPEQSSPAPNQPETSHTSLNDSGSEPSLPTLSQVSETFHESAQNRRKGSPVVGILHPDASSVPSVTVVRSGDKVHVSPARQRYLDSVRAQSSLNESVKVISRANIESQTHRSQMTTTSFSRCEFEGLTNPVCANQLSVRT